jgi:hypothetical protein
MRIVKFAVLGVAAVAVLGAVMMGLWNWLMPALFGLPQVGFLQALGLFLLSKLIFGGFRGGPGRHGGWRRRMSRGWEHMSPEERERFMQGLCGRGPVPDPAPGPGSGTAGPAA